MSSFWERTERWDTNQAHTETTTDKEASWKDLGTSMNEISFGFVATAILISMFIIMAIFEHLIRPNQSTEQSQNENQVSFGENQQQSQSQSVVKLGSSKPFLLNLHLFSLAQEKAYTGLRITGKPLIAHSLSMQGKY